MDEEVIPGHGCDCMCNECRRVALGLRPPGVPDLMLALKASLEAPDACPECGMQLVRLRATVRDLEARLDVAVKAADKALEALSDYVAGYGPPDNRDALIDEAGSALRDALAAIRAEKAGE